MVTATRWAHDILSILSEKLSDRRYTYEELEKEGIVAFKDAVGKVTSVKALSPLPTYQQVKSGLYTPVYQKEPETEVYGDVY